MLFPDRSALIKKAKYHQIATTTGKKKQESPQVEEICAKNTEWIFGLSLSTRFLQEPETTDRSNGRNAKAETLNSFLL
jgi:hypothetical protein